MGTLSGEMVVMEMHWLGVRNQSDENGCHVDAMVAGGSGSHGDTLVVVMGRGGGVI